VSEALGQFTLVSREVRNPRGYLNAQLGTRLLKPTRFMWISFLPLTSEGGRYSKLFPYPEGNYYPNPKLPPFLPKRG
jgi:hypothetical protein